MRHLIYASLLLAAPAAAQPVTQPNACTVTIARAPDDVRIVVEAWVKTEPQCSVALEVRIVPTEGGYYLLAQDEHGRMRERVVPDAQSAGVLVASWIADDNAPPLPAIAPVAPPAAVAPAPVVAPPPPSPRIAPREPMMPPGLAPMVQQDAPPPAVQPATRRWITAGIVLPLARTSSAGLRVEADVIRRGRWLFGGAASLVETEMLLINNAEYADFNATDVRVLAYVARPWHSGRWAFRPTFAVGAIRSTGRIYGAQMDYSFQGMFPTAEASFVIHRELGKSWALHAGPLLSLMSQRYEASDAATVVRQDVDITLFAGVRHRL